MTRRPTRPFSALATLAHAIAAAGVIAITACEASPVPLDPHIPGPGSPAAVRSYRMGFSAIPPRPSQDDVLATLDLWTQRGDAAIMHISVPYKALLSGTPVGDWIAANELPLAQYYRAKNLQLFITLDVTDGLNRAAESPELVELGRSITEPVVQQVYRAYAVALAQLVQPEYLGLAAETNLIRMTAPTSLYDALRQMVNAAAADLDAIGSSAIKFVSVQVDAAWGHLLHNGTYQGVEADFNDFPFVQALGLSSYPYFVFAQPEDVPLDYYTRLLNGRPLPVMVVEGGWPSEDAATVTSTPELQARYLRHHAEVLDSARARAVFQLTFTDLDVDALNLPPGSILPHFSRLGLVDMNLQPKPALAVWDSLFALPRSN